MIRIFNHYMHRMTLLSVAADILLLFLAVVGIVAMQVDSLRSAMPLAGTHAASLAAGLLLINSASGFYAAAHNRSVSQTCARGLFALFLALPFTWLVFSLVPVGSADRGVLQLAAMAGMSVVILHRVLAAHGATQLRRRTRVLIYGAGPAAQVVGSTLAISDPNVEIVGYLPGPNEKECALPESSILDPSLSLQETATRLRVDEIVVALTERRAGSMPLRELLDCKLGGIKVFDLNTHFEKALGQIRVDYVKAGWLVFGDGFNQGWGRTTMKRCFDIVGALALLLPALPVMLVTSILIKLESRGPVLYRQERVGLAGRVFEVIKFRSMRTDAERDGQPRWASANDDRVTRVGHIIRRLRIDELPQLFNVLIGQMSLVGPRPERPFFVEQLTQRIPYYSVRHSVKPGVTGWAQVRYQYGATVEDSQEKLQYDLYYVKNHTLFLDLIVLFETVGVVLTGKGAR